MSLRKVGGIWFWKFGRLGGSVYMSKATDKPPVNADWLGMSVCFMLAISYVIS